MLCALCSIEITKSTRARGYATSGLKLNSLSLSMLEINNERYNMYVCLFLDDDDDDGYDDKRYVCKVFFLFKD